MREITEMPVCSIHSRGVVVTINPNCICVRDIRSEGDSGGDESKYQNSECTFISCASYHNNSTITYNLYFYYHNS